MTEREKVIKGLEHCADDACTGCPYFHECNDGDIDIKPSLLSDALKLLKEYVYGTRYVPVVRCYECQYWEPENAEEGDASGMCMNGYSPAGTTDMNWFCADGEREG